ncbi:type II toxin-antitoxin system RatA family toxin [Pantoea sp. BAV 3049]|uniref:type II toxin-antitoxin system RatA family toxin n=1 Tax=Pantoea sp. BAV 3049 TaxID=2654188 RepID=UPI00131AEB4C|nr:type II toxin-antitoxin system RatA family toxin [Pantoea sp. BAV 3049]
MTTFEKTMLVNFSQNQMYNLVADVSAYPEFLPWCQQVEILEVQPGSKVVRIGVSHPRLPRLNLTTRATFHPDTSLLLKQVSGSFLAAFEGHWQFACNNNADGADSMHQCSVTFTVSYRFSNALMKLALSPFFAVLVRMLPELFVQRAAQVYAR